MDPFEPSPKKALRVVGMCLVLALLIGWLIKHYHTMR